MSSSWSPSTKQVNAMKAVEAALKQCKAAQLSIYGMDSELLVVSSHIAKGRSMEEIVCEHGHDCHSAINNHGCYMDSGGW